MNYSNKEILSLGHIFTITYAKAEFGDERTDRKELATDASFEYQNFCQIKSLK